MPPCEQKKSAAFAAFILCMIITASGVMSGKAAVSYHSFSEYNTSSAASEELCEGVLFFEYTLNARPGNGKEIVQHVFVLEMEPKANKSITLAAGMAGGFVRGWMTTLESAGFAEMPEGYEITAGVNGDFFDMASGGPLGYTMSGGRWITSGEFDNGWAFGVTADGSARIAMPSFSLSFSAERTGKSIVTGVPVNALNCLRADIPPEKSTPANARKSRKDNNLVLFTPDYYTSTMTYDGGYEVLIKTPDRVVSNGTVSGTVIAVSDEHTDTKAGKLNICQGTRLSPGTMVLSGCGESMQNLQMLSVGDTVTIGCAVSENWSDIITCAGGGRPDGGPLLVENGIICKEDKTVSDYQYFYSRNPRTAAGVRADGTYFLLLIEGGRSGVRDGVTIRELSQIALDLGAEYAVNLDGGPSSTMVIQREEKLTVVSDTTGRSGFVTAVGNSLYIITACSSQ